MLKKLLSFFSNTSNADVSDSHEEKPLYSFASLSSQILESKGDAEKLRLCRLALPGLPSFVKGCMEQDGELPPVVPVRDVMPEMLMRFGEWKEAEDVIRLCISCGAYGHTEYRNSRDNKGHWVSETGHDELEALRKRHAAADAALSFLADNPGTLQSKMYKIPALSNVDHDALVWFCRSSNQIRKEQGKSSKHLFVAGGDPS